MVGHTHGLTTLLAGFPFRHRLDDAHGFFVAATTDTTEQLHVGDGAIGFNNETDEHTALDTSFTGNLRILDVFTNILHQFLLAAREGRHLFHDLEDLLFHDFFFHDLRGNILFDDFVLFHFGVDVDVFSLYVVVHNFELSGLLGLFHRLRLLFLLLGDFHHFLVQYDLAIEQAFVNLALVVALVLEGQPCDEQADDQTYLREHHFLVLKISLR